MQYSQLACSPDARSLGRESLIGQGQLERVRLRGASCLAHPKHDQLAFDVLLSP